MKHILVLLIFSIAVISCSNEKKKDLPENFDYGKAENGTYFNNYFDLKIQYPEEWTVVEGEQLKRFQKLGEEFAAGDNDQLKSIMRASEINSAQILSLFRYDMITPVPFNHNLQVVVENLKNYPEISNGEDYLKDAKQMLLSTAMDIKITQDVGTLDIGGKEMKGLIVTNTIKNLVINQTYLSTVKNGFCINFILSYIDDDQREELYEIISTMEM